MKDVTVACHYVRAVTAAIERKGVDSEELLEVAHIAPSVIQDPQVRVPRENFVRLVRRAWAVLEDENLGLTRNPLPLGAFYYVSHLMINAPTLRGAIELGNGLYRYINKDWALQLHEHEDVAQFQLVLADDQRDPDHLLAEFLLTGWHNFCAWLIGRSIPLREATFTYAAPAHEAEYQHLFPCPRYYNHHILSLSFSRQYLDRPVVQSLPELKDYILTTPLYLFINPVNDQSYDARIRRLLADERDENFPPFDAIAKDLYMTPKTLRQKLKAEGVSYQKIKDMMRRDRAIHYLTNSTLPVAEIAGKAGFSETGAFIRAFKSWTGVTPGVYRKGLDDSS